MSADFADTLRTDRHDADLGDIDYLLTPAEQFRLGQAQEHDEAMAAFGGIATLHRWTRVAVTQYVTCDCRDGSHPLTSLVYDTEHEHIARAEAAYTPGGHVYARTVLTLTSPPDGDLP